MILGPLVPGVSDVLSKSHITPKLQELINKARHVHMSKEDIDEQRVSWVYGNLKGRLTKDQVREMVLGGNQSK